MAAQITYVQFRDPVGVGGDDGAIGAWSAIKHLKGDARVKPIAVSVQGNFVVLRLDDGRTRKVPMANVVYIAEDAE